MRERRRWLFRVAAAALLAAALAGAAGCSRDVIPSYWITPRAPHPPAPATAALPLVAPIPPG